MSLRYALLALLRVGPLSGYDLKKQFSVSVGHVWHAPDSQIYPELKRMTDAGLLHPEDVPRGPKGTRTLYHVTEAGEEAYREWFSQESPYQRVRDPARLKSAYLESATVTEQKSFFEAHIAHWQGELETAEAELARLRERTSPTLLRRLENLAEKEKEAAVSWKIFAYEGLVSQAKTELDWGRRGLELANSLSSGRP